MVDKDGSLRNLKESDTDAAITTSGSAIPKSTDNEDVPTPPVETKADSDTSTQEISESGESSEPIPSPSLGGQPDVLSLPSEATRLSKLLAWQWLPWRRRQSLDK